MKQLFVWTLFSLFLTPGRATEQDIERVTITHNETLPSLNKYLIDQATIESTASLSELLASLPAVQIRHIGGVGNPVAISIRGSSNQQVNLRIDGQLINTSQAGGFDIDQIPVALIESIEVSQFQSGDTGPTPIGGEIRINTFRSDTSHNSAALAVGAFGLREINLRTSLKVHSHQVVASINHLSSDNDYHFVVPQSISNSQVSSREALRNNQFQKTTLFLSDEFSSLTSTSRINAQLNKQEKALPNYQNNSPDMASNLKNTNIRLGVEQNWQDPFSSIESFDVEGYWFTKDETFVDAPSQHKYDVYQYDTEQAYAQLKSTFVHDRFRLLPYINLNQQWYTSDSLIGNKPPECNGTQFCDVEARQMQVNIGSRLSWQNNKGDIQYSVLYNRLFTDNRHTPRHAPREEATEHNVNYTSAEINIDTQVQNHRLSLHLARGLRTPTLNELFGDRGLFKGNQNLKAETSNAITVSAQSFWSKLTMQNTLFYQDVENTIVAIFNGSGIGSYSNVSASSLLGWSTSFKYMLSPKLTVLANLDILDSNTRSEYRAFHNKKLPGIYHQQVLVAADYQLTEYLQMRLSTRFDTELYFDRANIISNARDFDTERNTTQFQLSWLRRDYTVSLNINNLFQQTYYDLAYRPAEGRNIQLKLIIKDF